MPTETLLSLEDVAKALGVSKRTVTRQVDAGKLRAVKVGRSMKFKQEAIDEYLKKQEVSGTQNS